MRFFLIFLSLCFCGLSHAADGDITITPDSLPKEAVMRITPDSSLTDAVRKAREMRRLGQADKVTIVLSRGFYQLYESLVLRPEDSGLHFVGDDKNVIISGGLPVTEWRQNGKLLEADIPDFNGRPMDFRQVWVNGEKAVRARDVTDFEQMHRIINVDKKKRVIWVPTQAVKNIVNAPYAEMVLHEMWCVANLRIKLIDIDGDSAAVSFHNPESKLQFEHPWPSPMYNSDHDSPFYLTNAMELLDTPGEWYYDIRSRKLYYYPKDGQTPDNIEVFIPAIETLVEVEGTPEERVCDVTFENIAFAFTTWMRPSLYGHVPLQAGMYLTEAYKLRPQIDRPNNHKLDNQGWLGRADAAVRINYGEGVSFHRCSFFAMGGSGVDYEEGCLGGKVSDCKFADIAMNGYVCGSFSPKGLETHKPYRPADDRVVCSGQEVTNTLFTNIGNEDWGCVAIAAGYVRNIDINHNEICEVPYSGISLGWGWNRDSVCMRDNKITANLIYHYAKHMYDCAGIYTLGNQPGTVISRNVVRDIYSPSYVHDPNHWFYLYTDEGSSNITLRDNWTPSDKYLKNAVGPGNVWENNGPDVDKSIVNDAGRLVDDCGNP